MLYDITPAVLLAAAFLGACAAVLAGIGSLQWMRRFPDGFLHYYFYAVIFSNALGTLLSGRNFAAVAGEEFQEVLTSNPTAEWAIRLTSLFTLFAALDQIVRYFSLNKKLDGSRIFLAFTFICFWISSVVIPAFFSAHPADLQLPWFYSLVLGLGMIFMMSHSAAMSVLVCRNAILIFCGVSLLLTLIKPDLVMDRGYTQGYIPGVPRFAGLAPHPIVMGMISALGLWCLLAYPMKKQSLNKLSWSIGLIALFFAQSKTVWTSFFIGLPIIFYFQGRIPGWRTMVESRQRTTFSTLGILILLGIAAATIFILFGDLGSKLDRFLSSDQGAQITTLTGRLQIWDVALYEWDRFPFFGYGLSLFGPEHRAQIGMSFATSGHNQFIDALGRTGSVGAIGTFVYLLGLFWLGLRFARPSHGLSAALTVSIAIRTVTEIPIGLGGIGMDTLPYYVLLAVIAANLGNKGTSHA